VWIVKCIEPVRNTERRYLRVMHETEIMDVRVRMKSAVYESEEKCVFNVFACDVRISI